jgi:uncharacterized membrane protein YeaQ/YmgE (transglycosylase-associated protein family)
MFWRYGIIISLLIGALAGGIAGRLTRGRGFGCLGNIIVGIIGGFVGGWLFNLANFNVGGGFWGTLLTATVGATALLVVLNLIFGGGD